MLSPSTRTVVRAAVLLLGLVCACAPASPQERLQGEIIRLEARLVAPCCWTQTLDNHESALARTLREEIVLRLGRGEDAGAIEADLVTRYGPRIRATGDGVDLNLVPIVGAVSALLAFLAATLLSLRWVRRGRALAPAAAVVAVPAPGAPAALDRFDDQLDEELERMD